MREGYSNAIKRGKSLQPSADGFWRSFWWETIAYYEKESGNIDAGKFVPGKTSPQETRLAADAGMRARWWVAREKRLLGIVGGSLGGVGRNERQASWIFSV